MSIHAISSLSGSVSPHALPASVTSTDGIGAPKTATQGAGQEFAKVVAQLVTDANAQHAQAANSMTQLMNGEATNVHEVVMETAKADMAFRLLMEIRNRLIDSYQEVMRMQI